MSHDYQSLIERYEQGGEKLALSIRGLTREDLRRLATDLPPESVQG